MHLDLPHRFPWSTALSVALHGAVVVGLLYVSVTHISEPQAQGIEQAISVTMVAPAALAAPEPVAPPPEPVVEPEPEPEPEVQPEPEPEPVPVPEPEVVINKPKPKPKPEPKPKPKPKPEKKAVERPKPAAKPVESNPFATQTAKSAVPAASTPTAAAPSTSQANSGPTFISRGHPEYPPRALALRLEGKVKVKFDVDADGRVGNIQILSAQPANVFEREVRRAMTKWRYKSGSPGTGLTVDIIFRTDGSSNVQ